jgi:hypothetical protein
VLFPVEFLKTWLRYILLAIAGKKSQTSCRLWLFVRFGLCAGIWRGEWMTRVVWQMMWRQSKLCWMRRQALAQGQGKWVLWCSTGVPFLSSGRRKHHGSVQSLT